jgi:hypothetical protein
MSDSVQAVRGKEKSLGFAALGIPLGATLVFKKDPAVTVKTLDDKNKVEYQGKPYSISSLAKQLIGSPVSGYLYFKFEGKVLKNLGKSAIPEKAEPAGAGKSDMEEAIVKNGGISAEISDGTGVEIDPLAGESEAVAAE